MKLCCCILPCLLCLFSSDCAEPVQFTCGEVVSHKAEYKQTNKQKFKVRQPQRAVLPCCRAAICAPKFVEFLNGECFWINPMVCLVVLT